MNFYEKIKEKTGFSGLKLLAVMLIMVVAIFLRTYNFHDWLDFKLDQVRDATLVGNILEDKSSWPLLGPTMRRSTDSKENLFHIGPAYYYLQIASAKVFGNEPDKLAYPDLLFSILAIPLMCIFLRIYFSASISLVLAGLYAVSFFAILYSRFAWNPNLIPFFVLLFLVSTHEFLLKKVKTEWIWIILLGISAGIGIQLHMILFILIPASLFFVFVFLMKKDCKTLSKWTIVILIVIILNIPQIVSEVKSNFANTKIFVNSIISSIQNEDEEKNILQKVGDGMDCHIEANAYIISAKGSNGCGFSYMKLLSIEKPANFLKKIQSFAFWINIILDLAFSIFGYVFLIRYFRKEKEESKKYFLGLIILYAALSFVIMIPIFSANLTEFRYFIHVFFVPFLFVGFFMNFLSQKYSKKYFLIVFLLFIFLIFTNFYSIFQVAKELSLKSRSDKHNIVLGEAESMMKYVVANSDNQKEAYFVGNNRYMSNFSKPFSYLAKKQDFNIINASQEAYKVEIPRGKPVFYIWKNSNYVTEKKFDEREIENFKNFGQIGIYKLQN